MSRKCVVRVNSEDCYSPQASGCGNIDVSGSPSRYRATVESFETIMTMTPSQQFAAWLAPAMRRAGLDIDAQRGGGRTILADRLGVSASSIKRWLDGESMPTPDKFEAIATALNYPVIEMLVEIGVLSAKAVTPTPTTGVDFQPTTPSRAADELGITDPGDRALFLALVDRLNQGPRQLPDSNREDTAAQG